MREFYAKSESFSVIRVKTCSQRKVMMERMGYKTCSMKDRIKRRKDGLIKT